MVTRLIGLTEEQNATVEQLDQHLWVSQVLSLRATPARI
jgi:hypothetical protein